jgi:hypothetical protein
MKKIFIFIFKFLYTGPCIKIEQKRSFTKKTNLMQLYKSV